MMNENFDDESEGDKTSQETTRKGNEVVKNVEETDGITEAMEEMADETVKDDTEKKSRKRIRKPEKWERNIKKLKVNKGEEYTTKLGRLVPRKCIKEDVMKSVG